MGNLDLKRAEVELFRVQSAKKEMELKILEKEEEIARLNEHLRLQSEKEKELSDKLNALKGA